MARDKNLAPFFKFLNILTKLKEVFLSRELYLETSKKEEKNDNKYKKYNKVTARVTKKPDRKPREWELGEYYDVSIEELYERIERETSRQNFISANIYKEMIALRLGDTKDKITRELSLRGNLKND